MAALYVANKPRATAANYGLKMAKTQVRVSRRLLPDPNGYLPRSKEGDVLLCKYVRVCAHYFWHNIFTTSY
jgi:hypothetical protein